MYADQYIKVLSSKASDSKENSMSVASSQFLQSDHIIHKQPRKSAFLVRKKKNFHSDHLSKLAA